MYKANPKKALTESGQTQEQNMQLLVMKYEEALAQPINMKANREFLML